MGYTKERIAFALAGGTIRILLYVCVAMALLWVGRTSYQFGHDVFNEQAVSPGEGQEIAVVIRDGSSAYEIGKLLENKGLIDNAFVFYVQERLSLYHGQLKGGTYVLSTAYTPSRMMEIIATESGEFANVAEDRAS